MISKFLARKMDRAFTDIACRRDDMTVLIAVAARTGTFVSSPTPELRVLH